MENLYFILIILPIVILSHLADKKNKKTLLYISILWISVLVGFRGQNVGVDTSSYIHSIVNGFPYSWLYTEIGFRNISILLFNLFKNGHIVLFIFALITNLLIFLRLWDFRKKCSLSFMVFLYLCLYMFSSMNIMRQFIAISVIFYSTRFLEEKKFLRYFIIVLLMTLIHKTSVLGMVLIIPYYWKALSPRKKILVIVPFCIAILICVKYSLNLSESHIENYLSAGRAIKGINIPFLYRLIIFLISYFIYQKNIIITFNRKNTLKLEKRNDNTFKIISAIYFIGLCFNSIGLFFNLLSRISYYYMLFECIYWGYMVKNSNNKKINFLMITIFAGYAFISELIVNGNNIFPYYIEFF